MNREDFGPTHGHSLRSSFPFWFYGSEPFCTVFRQQKDESISGRHKQGAGGVRVPPAKRSEMHRDDLMNPDLLSEIVLLGSATLIFITLLAIVVTAFSRVAAL
jgi:hypothetical protein